MRAQEFTGKKIATAEQVWDYVSKIHPADQQGGGFLKKLILRNPQYELKRVPLSNIHIPDQEYDDEEQDAKSNDPYGRAMFVDPGHAGEYSQHYVDRSPIVVDAEGHILDGNHRAWAAANLLNKSNIMAWVPVLQLKEGQSVKQEIKDFIDSLTPADVGVEEFPGYRIHYEGFTDDCKLSSDYQKNPNKVYQQVYQDFIDREGGKKPAKSGMTGDEEYPILYSVFRVPQSKSVDTAERAYSIAYKKKQPWPRGSREEKLIRSDWQLSGLYDQYVLKQGVAEDAENFNGIDISMEVEGDEIMVRATAGGRELGHVLFVEDGEYLMPQDLEVEERFQGQGIAAAMYDYVKSKGYKIRRSGQQTDAGAGFWRKNRGEENVWENFADGKVKGKSRPGRVKRSGASCDGSVTDLRARAKRASGEKAKMYHWCANMKSGRNK